MENRPPTTHTVMLIAQAAMALKDKAVQLAQNVQMLRDAQTQAAEYVAVASKGWTRGRR